MVSPDSDRPLFQDEVGVGSWDLDGRLLAFNQVAVERLGGAHPDQYVGKTINELFGRRGEPYLERIRRAAVSADPMLYEDCVELPIGVRWTTSVFTRRLDAAGTVTSVDIHTIDTTDRKLAQDALALQNEALLRLNSLAIELSLESHDDDLESLVAKRLKEVSGAETVMFSEYDPLEKSLVLKHVEMEPGLLKRVVGLLGRRLDRFAAPVTEETYRAITMEAVGLSKSLYDASFGSISRPVSRAIERLLGVNRFVGMAHMVEGQLYGTSLIALGEDRPDPPVQILENFSSLAALALRRRQAEKALKQSQELFSLYLSNSPVYTYIKEVTPSESRVLHASHNFVEMVGTAGEDMIGKTMAELFPAEFAAKMTADDWSVASADRTVKLEEELGGRSYTTIKFPIKQRDKTLVAGYTIDITEQKNLEEARRSLERQLHQSQKLESLGILAGGIAHDFNNILSSILGNAELALDDLPDSHPARDNLLGIARASHRAASLCSQMLAYSGRGKFVNEAVDLNALVEELLHLLRASISKKAALELHLTPGLPVVNGDPGQLSQVVMNLVINASEALEDHDGVISISTAMREYSEQDLLYMYAEHELMPGSYLSLQISDNGSGMDEETKKRLFEPFFTTKFTGRGLGLSAVLGIVRGHGGALGITSELGNGTVFDVVLPASYAVPAVTFAGAGAEARVESHPECSILLVDDEESIRTLGSMMLSRLGYTVLVGADGQEAIEVYRANRGAIHLVLLDLTMPRMDGLQTFRALRDLDPHVRVVMSSGYTEHELESRLSEASLAGFLRKPYTMDELSAKIRTALCNEMPPGSA